MNIHKTEEDTEEKETITEDTKEIETNKLEEDTKEEDIVTKDTKEMKINKEEVVENMKILELKKMQKKKKQ